MKMQLSWKKWRISSFHPKNSLEIGQDVLNFLIVFAYSNVL